MRSSIAILLLLTMRLAAEEPQTFSVRGTVLDSDHGPIPGCLVVLSKDEFQRFAVSQVDGEYSIFVVLPGTYDLRFELPGFHSETETITVTGDTVVSPRAMRVSSDITVVTVTCGGPPCDDDTPKRAYDLPLCAEYERDSLLIDALGHGDRSALDSLERRFDAEVTYAEKHRTARALLRRASDDRRYWSALESFANDAVRFAYVGGQPPRAFVEWCEQHGARLETHRALAIGALFDEPFDARMRPWVERALQTTDLDLIKRAMLVMAKRRDESLP